MQKCEFVIKSLPHYKNTFIYSLVLLLLILLHFLYLSFYIFFNYENGMILIMRTVWYGLNCLFVGGIF